MGRHGKSRTPPEPSGGGKKGSVPEGWIGTGPFPSAAESQKKADSFDRQHDYSRQRAEKKRGWRKK